MTMLSPTDGPTIVGDVPDEVLSLVAAIDDFAPDFEERRATALAATYGTLGTTTPLTGQYTEYLGDDFMIDRISTLVGRSLVPADDQGTGRFSLRTADTALGLDIHADGCYLGAILYLNEPDQCRGGTSIFRHRETGLWSFPSLEEQAELGLADSPDGYMEFFTGQEGIDRSKWEEVVRVPMRSNRLVIVAGGLFHSHTTMFGADLEDGRLVQLFFLNPSD